MGSETGRREVTTSNFTCYLLLTERNLSGKSTDEFETDCTLVRMKLFEDADVERPISQTHRRIDSHHTKIQDLFAPVPPFPPILQRQPR
jgi:hypothetical protein